MKIVITGHASGIGKVLVSELIRNGHTIIGLDIEKGDDIHDADSIVEKAKDADVFINNAYAPTAQRILLQKIFQVWREDSTKTIINMSSKAKYFPVGHNQLTEYTLEKRMLSEEFQRCQFYSNKKCRLIGINPGFVETAMTESMNVPKLSPEVVVEAIVWALGMPQEVEIGELGIWTTQQ
jgi:NAD(P)-dependent dehydrogenase (short-subunit alcohol dehydrogenase family)